MMVHVERFIEEVYNDESGECYQGYLTINHIKFEFTLELKIQRRDLLSIIQGRVENKSKVGRLIEFSLHKNGTKINCDTIDYDELCFFHGLLTNFKSGICVPLGVVNRELIDIAPKICKILNSPKYDCKIAM